MRKCQEVPGEHLLLGCKRSFIVRGWSSQMFLTLLNGTWRLIDGKGLGHAAWCGRVDESWSPGESRRSHPAF